ncbi:MAG: replication restart DNA helicase PriA [Microcoleaceae cyanobacterium]
MPLLEKTFEVKTAKILKKHKIRCSNCGSYGERIYHENLTHTECPACDYLMITRTSTGEVVEAYAPGIYPG